MRELNPDGSIRRLVRHSAKCSCGSKSEVFLQEHGNVTMCMACAIRARLVTRQMLDINSVRFPRSEERRAPPSGKGTKWHEKQSPAVAALHLSAQSAGKP